MKVGQTTEGQMPPIVTNTAIGQLYGSSKEAILIFYIGRSTANRQFRVDSLN